MNQELKTMLEAVLQQSLQPIHFELQSLNKRVGNMEEQFKTVKDDLQNVKSELKTVKDDLQMVKKQLNETTDITKAIRDRQEETDAKLDPLSMDINKIHDEIPDLKTRLAFNASKINEIEFELFKLKNE